MASIRKRTWISGGEPRQAWQVSFTDQNGRRRTRQFARKREADQWLVSTRGRVQKGTYTADSTSATLGEAVDLWLERAAAEGLERATRDHYRKLSEHVLAAIDRRTKLSRITQAMCEQLRDRLLLAHSRLIASKALQAFKAILKDARRRGLVAQNVAAETRISSGKRHRRHLEVGVDVPTPAEVKTLIGTAAPKARALVCLAALAGLRASELRGLRWSDLDLGARPSVTVAQRADFASVIGSPKSLTSRRTIPLGEVAARALKEWRRAQPPGRSLVFGTSSDRPDSLPNLRRRVLFPALVAAGGPRYSAHAFRHYAISSWLASGVDLKTAQHWAGHATLSMTLDTYSHLLPRQDDHTRIAAAEALIR